MRFSGQLAIRLYFSPLHIMHIARNASSLQMRSRAVRERIGIRLSRQAVQGFERFDRLSQMAIDARKLAERLISSRFHQPV
jgi:hypothetical protein